MGPLRIEKLDNKRYVALTAIEFLRRRLENNDPIKDEFHEERVLLVKGLIGEAEPGATAIQVIELMDLFALARSADDTV